MTPPKRQTQAAVTISKQDIELAPKTISDTDPFLVDFDNNENPQDWSGGRKWIATDVLSATGFNRIMVSTIMAPALTTIAAELHMSPTEAALSLSIYLLATAFGPLFIGPLSEVYGRRTVMHVSNVWFLVWNIACGFAKTKQVLIASRFLAGFGASAIYSLSSGVLGDLWRAEQRGRTLSYYALIPLLGAAVGPIIGGFMAGRTTWRWMFWATSCFQAVMVAIAMFTFPETYAPLILRRKAAKIRKETGDSRYYTAEERLIGQRSVVSTISRAMQRPYRLLTTHPITQITAVVKGFEYGLLYVVLSTYSGLWIDRYGQSVEVSGLHYIAVSLGEIIGSQVSGRVMDWHYKKQGDAAVGKPESRLSLTIPGLILGGIGTLMYGWTAQCLVHWAVVDLAIIIMMGSQQMVMTISKRFQCTLCGRVANSWIVMAYVIDVYGPYTSSASSANQFVSSLCAFLFPLFAPSMYSKLGYGWGNTLLGGIWIIMAFPLPFLLPRYGPKLREKGRSLH